MAESLDELEKVISTLFGNVVDKDVKQFCFSKYHPWGYEQMRYKVYMKPVFDEKQILRLNFPVSGDQECHELVS